MFSMLTDPFSSHLIRQGVTREALKIVLAETGYRIRVLTKSCAPSLMLAASCKFIGGGMDLLVGLDSR